MAKQDGYSTGCVAIGYEWSVYKDMLSVVVQLDYDSNEIKNFYVYTIDLRRDVLLPKDDVLEYLDVDEDLYEKDVQDALDLRFSDDYKDMMGTDEYMKQVYDKTIALSNVRDAVPYVDSDGDLSVIGKIYCNAGPEYQSRQLSVDTLDDECEYSGSVYESSYYKPTTEDYSSNDYILPYSDSEYLTEDDLDELTPDEIRLACNELYARHGRKFKDADYQAYFNSKSWYQGTVEPDDFDDTAVFNKYELANRDFIIAYEKEKGYK